FTLASSKAKWMKFSSVLKYFKKEKPNKVTYYDQLMKAYTKPSFYIPIYNRINAEKTPYLSNGSFVLKDMFPLGTALTKVQSVLGAPNHQAVAKLPVESHVWLYRTMIGKYRAHLRLHFVDMKLYYYNIQFRYLSSADIKLIIDTIEFKYLGGINVSNRDGFIIRDANDSHCLVNAGNQLELQFISQDEVLEHIIEFELDLKVAKASQIKIRNELQLMRLL
ncbi:MAG: hypothetical protein KDC92_13550, partial [Bacteroidetes bacterium]|nr:hypothetical protein [Bacteroidota bacterium]